MWRQVPIRVACVTLAATVAAVPAHAESPQSADANAERSINAPVATVGIGAGPVGRYQGIQRTMPAFLVSVYIPVTRFIVVEGTATQWAWMRPRHILWAAADERWSTLSVGANVTLRAGKGRISGSIGTGVGFQQSTLLDHTCRYGCESLPADRQFGSYALRTSPSVQFVGGSDVALRPNVIAFAELLMIVGDEGVFMPFGGVRIPFGTRTFPRRPPPPFPPADEGAELKGKKVRLTAMDGTERKGRIVSLSSTEVILRFDDRNTTIPLRDVRRLDKVAYGVRNGAIAGAAAGYYVGYGVGESDSPGGEVGQGILFSAIGAGIGAGIGIVIDAAKADRNLIYLAPNQSAPIVVAPMVSAKRAGVGLSLRW
jgi:hypothetical protein